MVLPSKHRVWRLARFEHSINWWPVITYSVSSDCLPALYSGVLLTEYASVSRKWFGNILATLCRQNATRMPPLCHETNTRLPTQSNYNTINYDSRIAVQDPNSRQNYSMWYYSCPAPFEAQNYSLIGPFTWWNSAIGERKQQLSCTGKYYCYR